MASRSDQHATFKVGDRAMILVRANGSQSSSLERKRVFGTIKFIGSTHFADGEWVGLMLDREFEDHAKNDGCVQKTRYFDTNGENLGLFVRSQGVRIADKKKDSNEQVVQDYRQREKMVLDLENIQAQLEVSEVERQVLAESNKNLEKQLELLKLKCDAIDLLKSQNEEVTEESMKYKMLETEMLQSKELSAEKELQLYQYIAELEEQLEDVRSKLSTIESRFEVTMCDLAKYEEENKDLVERLSVLQPGSAEEIIEKLTEHTMEYTNKISNLEATVNIFKERETENKEIEKEYVLTIESLNNIIKELEEQFGQALSKCTLLETQLIESSETIKLLKLKINSEPHSTITYNIFHGISKLSDDRLFDFLQNSHAPNKSIILLKKLITSHEIALRLLEKYPTSDKWREFNATCTVYINSLNSHPQPILSSIASELETFLDKFWMFLEEGDYLDLIFGIDLPFNWSSSYSEAENELIAREKLIYLSNDSNILQLRNTFQGIHINSFCLELISSWNTKNISVDTEKLSFITLIESDVVAESIPNEDEVSNLKYKIQALQIKLKDDQELQHELHLLGNDLETKKSEKFALEEELEKANVKMNNLTSDYSSVVSLMNKLGLNTRNQMHEPIINDYEVIEKVNLLNMIDTQRNMITKLTDTDTIFESETCDWLSKWPESRKIKASSYSRRIEVLFEMNINTKNDINYHEMKMLEYLARK